MAKNKHLVNEERSQIEHLLRDRRSIKEIARILGKSTSTISREIKKRAVPSDKSAAYRVRNRCIRRRNCTKIQLCEDKPDCTRRCSACKHCNSVCPDFVEEICQRLSSPPYVCNGCTDERICTLRKRYYLHRAAQKSYEELLVGSRAGANISEEGLIRLDGFLSPLIRKGQSIHHIFHIFHIFATNPPIPWPWNLPKMVSRLHLFTTATHLHLSKSPLWRIIMSLSGGFCPKAAVLMS